jgi:hypothetical protein
VCHARERELNIVAEVKSLRSSKPNINRRFVRYTLKTSAVVALTLSTRAAKLQYSRY